MSDARFEDAGGGPLRLVARDADDLRVISALLQDAVFPASEMRWDRGQRRFALLVNRFRWEDTPESGARKRPFERVQAMVTIDDVGAVASQGVSPGDADTVLSLLSVDFDAGADGGGDLILTLAGDGAIRLGIEALEVAVRDVTQPYRAVSGHKPHHPE